MSAIDYEAEYNNRARVPEHAVIFARWVRDAAAYRDKMTALGRAELCLSYGRGTRQTIDLFLPDAPESAPLALFVHGGYWRSLEPGVFSHLARGLVARGVSVGIAGYDLCPRVGIATIVDEIRQACLFLRYRFERRIMVYGHSAGGHLAACMVATDWKTLEPEAPHDLVPAGFAISGVFDLAPLIETAMNADFKLDAAEAHRLSPLFWPVGAGRTLDAIVGGEESSEFLRQSRTIVETWRRQARVETRYEAVPGANHFTVLDPLTDPESSMVARLAELAQRAGRGA